MKSPVLLMMFNRPDLAVQVLEVLRKVQAPALYLAVDGPRPERPDDTSAVKACQDLAGAIDWPCKVFTCFQERNLGCGRGVRAALDWFFEHEPEGIVLEDDTLPCLDFFRFCDELLDRYRDDPGVMSIGGFNEVGAEAFDGLSYAFTRYNLIWGWASWRRAWSRHRIRNNEIPRILDEPWFRAFFPDAKVRRYWEGLLRDTSAGRIDTWDYPWRLTVWREGGLSILPNTNLVRNIGFDDRATHTPRAAQSSWVQGTGDLGFPLRPPANVLENARLSRQLEEVRFRIPGLVPSKPAPSRIRRWTRILRSRLGGRKTRP